MKVSEIFQVETPHAPGGLASVLNVMAEALVLEHVSTQRRDQDRAPDDRHPELVPGVSDAQMEAR